jgi:glucosamine-6-phosphate deaminase
VRTRVFSTPVAAARALAGSIAAEISAHPDLVLGLPTGRTPIPLYQELVALHREGRVDFSRATTFNLDEFVGIPRRDPRSYGAFMQRHLFDHINLPAGRRHVLNGMARAPEAECERYERAIARAGGLDLVILGLGANGHIGFNEPGDSLVARTHRTRLAPSTRRANASLFDGAVNRVPRHGLSMGMATILHARHIVVLATGAAKARCVEKMIAGPMTPGLPASFLQLHGQAEAWLDRAAAGSINRRGRRRTRR